MAPSEVLRQLVHAGAGGLALALAWLTWPQAAVLAGAAILANRFALPRLAPRLCRQADRDRGWVSGLVLYPCAVLVLVIVFRDRLDLAAAAWGILAVGDAMATLVGASVPSAPLPWNRAKSVAGLIAFVASSAPAALGLLLWTSGSSFTIAAVIMCVLAATMAGLVETLPIRLDDNVTVPMAAALVLWSCSLGDVSLFVERWPDVRILAMYGLAANVCVAIAGWWCRTVTVAGAATGAAIGTVTVAGFGWRGWILLLATFVIASASTRLGQARKAAAATVPGTRSPIQALRPGRRPSRSDWQTRRPPGWWVSPRSPRLAAIRSPVKSARRTAARPGW